MRIIHTSDWHLGRRFHGVSLLASQATFGDWFVELVRSEKADLVVIAGDIYDRSIAPTEAIELFGDIVARLLADGVVVAAITGNHDSAERAAPYATWLDVTGLYLRGGYDQAGSVLTHHFEDGPLDLVLVPYLDPRAASGAFLRSDPAGDRTGGDGTPGVASAAIDDTGDTGGGADDDPPGGDAGGDAGDDAVSQARRRATHETILTTVLERARAALVSPRSVVVAHAFVTGGTPSDSERGLMVGGTGEVPASIFDGFSYGALGHLHRPQHVGPGTLRYSGTPIPYSFSEDHDKFVTVIDMDASGAVKARAVDVPVGRRVATIRGTMAELLDPGAFVAAHDAFVRAVVTDRETVVDARARLSEVYPHVLEVDLAPDGLNLARLAAVPDIRSRSPYEVVMQFWEQVEGAPPDEQMREVLRAAVEAVSGGPDSPQRVEATS